MKFREGHVFAGVCHSVWGWGGPMWPLPMMHCTSLYNPPSRHGPLRTGTPASDIWWSPLEIYSYSGWLGLLVWNIWHLKYSVIKCAFNKRLNHFILTVADQGFLRWGRQCEREVPTYCLATIFKTAWKWRKLDREGMCPKFYYVDPPLTNYNKIIFNE